MWNWDVPRLGYAANKQQSMNLDQKEVPDGLGFWTLEWMAGIDIESF